MSFDFGVYIWLLPVAAGLVLVLGVIIWRNRAGRSSDVGVMAYTAVFRSLADAVLILDKDHRIVDVNPAAEKLLTSLQKPLIGMPIHTVFPSFQPLIEQHDLPVREGIELQVDALPAYFEARISPIYTATSVAAGHVIVIRDVTEQRQTEEAERAQRLLAEALRDTASALNSTLDVEEVLQHILLDVERVLPHDTANVMLLQGDVACFAGSRGYSEQMWKTIHKRWLVEETPNLRYMMQTGEPIVISDVAQDRGWVDTPATRWIRSYVGAPIQRNNQIIGFINLDSATPNSYQPEHAERLQAFANQAAVALGNAQLFAELAERNSELDAYARTIAHDLKSPLGLINGYAELVAEYDLPIAGRAQLDIIQETIGRMEEMIDQLLLLAQLRDVEQTAVSVEVLPLIYSVISRFTDQIEAHNIIVQVESKELPPLAGHAPWLEEVFANLFSNAIKYIGSSNPEPRIRISGIAAGSMVRYQISDNGLGINPADQEKLFDMFTRFHREEAAGTGIGLPIVQRIVQKLGGEVGVESQSGQGSTFWFTLPAGEPAPNSFVGPENL